MTTTHRPLDMARADLDERDVQAVLDVMRSGRLALGPKIVEFERVMAEYVGVKHAVAVNSGTAALHVIVKALGLGPGDEVIVPSFTFAASINVLLFEGVTPVFVDITPDTYNLDPEDVRRRVTPRTKAVMVVDVFGHPAPWRDLQAIADEFGLHLIDDCCEALGAEYEGRKLGAFGVAGAFAFYPNKQITTGEGGMIVTNDDEVARVSRSLRNQGRPEMGAWLAHERLGYNYRISEMQAALGVSQMARLDEFVAARANVAAMYDDLLAGFEWIRAPIVRADVKMSYFVYVATLADGLDRDEVIAGLEARGVPARGYFAPIHAQPYVLTLFGDVSHELPVTMNAARRTLALPFHNHLPREDAERVVAALADVVNTLG